MNVGDLLQFFSTGFCCGVQGQGLATSLSLLFCDLKISANVLDFPPQHLSDVSPLQEENIDAAEVPPVVVANAKLIMRSSKKNIKYEGFQCVDLARKQERKDKEASKDLQTTTNPFSFHSKTTSPTPPSPSSIATNMEVIIVNMSSEWGRSSAAPMTLTVAPIVVGVEANTEAGTTSHGSNGVFHRYRECTNK
ncbi:hypothetical protein JHK86_010092 [Glycine max]|nr:hypothetical protein JHK86_010092 [Glycine max]